MRLVICLFICCTLFFAGCNFPSKAEVSFAYVNIDQMQLLTESQQGAGTNQFEDAWVFVNGQSIGVYELPREIALLNEEPGNEIELSIQAGIRENGINSSPRVYPFVGNYSTLLSLDEGVSLDLVPEFEYLADTKFRLVADFESDNKFGFDEDGDETTLIARSEDYAASGKKSGKISLAAGQILEQATDLIYNELPSNGSPIFLEIDYRGDIDLDVGLIGVDGNNLFKDYFVSLRSENGWKKSYVNLTDLVLASGFPGYQVLIGVDNSEGQSGKSVYIDNIKFLHF